MAVYTRPGEWLCVPPAPEADMTFTCPKCSTEFATEPNGRGGWQWAITREPA